MTRVDDVISACGNAIVPFPTVRLLWFESQRNSTRLGRGCACQFQELFQAWGSKLARDPLGLEIETHLEPSAPEFRKGELVDIVIIGWIQEYVLRVLAEIRDKLKSISHADKDFIIFLGELFHRISDSKKW